MQSHRRNIVTLLAAVIGFAAVGFALTLRERSTRARHDVSVLAREVQSVTVYDIDGFRGATATKTELNSVTAASFPPQVFAQAAASASHTNQPALWKGSSLVVIVLRDGTERRAALSYYGGFFEVHGSPGHFRVPGASDSEFDRTFHRLIGDHFIPARFAKNQTNGA
jgi:hypothetical protein